MGPLSPFNSIIENHQRRHNTGGRGRGLWSEALSERTIQQECQRRAAAPVKKKQKKKKTTMGDATGSAGSRCGGTTAVVFALKPRPDAWWDTQQEVMSRGTGESRGERMGSNRKLLLQQHPFKISVN